MDTESGFRPFDVFHPECPSRQAFENIFSRWGFLTLLKLSDGQMRFGSLRRAIGGISEKMLAQTLKALEDEGLVHRQEWQEKLPRVEYSLTDSGRHVSQNLAGVIRELYGELAKRQGVGAGQGRSDAAEVVGD